MSEESQQNELGRKNRDYVKQSDYKPEIEWCTFSHGHNWCRFNKKNHANVEG